MRQLWCWGQDDLHGCTLSWTSCESLAVCCHSACSGHFQGIVAASRGSLSDQVSLPLTGFGAAAVIVLDVEVMPAEVRCCCLPLLWTLLACTDGRLVAAWLQWCSSRRVYMMRWYNVARVAPANQRCGRWSSSLRCN